MHDWAVSLSEASSQHPFSLPFAELLPSKLDENMGVIMPERGS